MWPFPPLWPVTFHFINSHSSIKFTVDSALCFTSRKPSSTVQVWTLRALYRHLLVAFFSHPGLFENIFYPSHATTVSDKEESCEEMSVPGSPQAEAIQHSSISTSNGVGSSSSSSSSAPAAATSNQSTEEGQPRRGSRSQPSGSWWQDGGGASLDSGQWSLFILGWVRLVRQVLGFAMFTKCKRFSLELMKTLESAL